MESKEGHERLARTAQRRQRFFVPRQRVNLRLESVSYHTFNTAGREWTAGNRIYHLWFLRNLSPFSLGLLLLRRRRSTCMRGSWAHHIILLHLWPITQPNSFPLATSPSSPFLIFDRFPALFFSTYIQFIPHFRDQQYDDSMGPQAKSSRGWRHSHSTWTDAWVRESNHRQAKLASVQAPASVPSCVLVVYCCRSFHYTVCEKHTELVCPGLRAICG